MASCEAQSLPQSWVSDLCDWVPFVPHSWTHQAYDSSRATRSTKNKDWIFSHSKKYCYQRLILPVSLHGVETKAFLRRERRMLEKSGAALFPDALLLPSSSTSKPSSASNVRPWQLIYQATGALDLHSLLKCYGTIKIRLLYSVFTYYFSSEHLVT